MTNAKANSISVNTAIHPNDQMFTGSLERYLSVGANAIANIEAILKLTGLRPNTILDYACGCGRVARHLRQRFPEATVVASDLSKVGTAFCAEQFGAIPHTPNARFEQVHFERQFDLIWSGSLMTHIDEGAAKAMIGMMVRSLAPNGVAIWTTHGRYPASMERLGRWPYNLSKERMRSIAEAFRCGRYGYSDYEHMKGYGISMTPLPWLYDTLAEHDVRVVALIERGWDNHQDVVSFQNRPIS